MGNFYEMQVMIAMYVGGIQVRGGAQSKFYKLIVGAMNAAFRKTATISRVSSEYSELIQGLILLLVVFFGNFIQKQFVRRQTMLAAKASVAADTPAAPPTDRSGRFGSARASAPLFSEGKDNDHERASIQSLPSGL